MTVPINLPLAISISAVAQTLARVDAAADYVAPYSDHPFAFETAGLWREAVHNGNVDDVIRHIQSSGIAPYHHLNDGARDSLRKLALRHPELRAELQEGAARIERAIGVSLPLRMSVYPGFHPSHLHRKGLILFLNGPDASLAVTMPMGGLQTFHVADPAGEAVPDFGVRSKGLITMRGHSPKIRGHFAESGIRDLAAYDLPGQRIFPLLSPLRASLSADVTRVGRFNFFGLRLDEDGIPIGARLEEMTRFQDQVDLLIFGGAAVGQDQLPVEWLRLLRPRMTLYAQPGATPTSLDGHRSVFPISSGEATSLDFDPNRKTMTVSDNRTTVGASWERESRLLGGLERLRAETTRHVFGNILGDRPAWRWSQSILNGAIPQALRYLLLLDSAPSLYETGAAKEEALVTLVDQMTDPLSLPGAAVDHVRVLKDLLIRSGLLERRDGS